MVVCHQAEREERRAARVIQAASCSDHTTHQGQGGDSSIRCTMGTVLRAARRAPYAGNPRQMELDTLATTAWSLFGLQSPHHIGDQMAYPSRGLEGERRSDRLDNLALLHPTCHRQVHS